MALDLGAALRQQAEPDLLGLGAAVGRLDLEPCQVAVAGRWITWRMSTRDGGPCSGTSASAVVSGRNTRARPYGGNVRSVRPPPCPRSVGSTKYVAPSMAKRTMTWSKSSGDGSSGSMRPRRVVDTSATSASRPSRRSSDASSRDLSLQSPNRRSSTTSGALARCEPGPRKLAK
jgi:hypothetical protein